MLSLACENIILMTKWFTADLHLDHQKLLDGSSRGLDYPDVDDWNSDIIDTINQLLGNFFDLFLWKNYSG